MRFGSLGTSSSNLGATHLLPDLDLHSSIEAFLHQTMTFSTAVIRGSVREGRSGIGESGGSHALGNKLKLLHPPPARDRKVPALTLPAAGNPGRAAMHGWRRTECD